MPEIHAQRRSRLMDFIRDTQRDAALITRLVNVRYLTGLDSSNAALLVTADGDVTVATDGRYATAAGEFAPDVELIVDRNVAVALVLHAGAGGENVKIGIEPHDVTLELESALRTEAEANDTKVEFSHLGRVVEKLRAVKDDDELALIRQACEISCLALEDLYAAGGFAGRTEKEVARDLEWRMYAHGADALAFDTIVASGPNSAIPHHTPTDRPVTVGDLLKIDFGAQYRGYHADCTRTAVVGAEPEQWQREIYDLVAAAQKAGRGALAVDTQCIDVDTASRVVIDDAGYGENFSHGTGHGVGLEIHEAPNLGFSATGTLADRMAVTVEPGIYLPGRGGVRIEDTLAVRVADRPDVLTPITKELLVLDA